MVSLTVTAQENHFVVNFRATSIIQSIDIVLEFLPLSEITATLIVGGVSAIEQSKIGSSLSRLSVVFSSHKAKGFSHSQKYREQ